MHAYSGVDPLDLTYARFMALVNAVPYTSAWVGSRITEPAYDGMQADRENRIIVMKMWFPTFFPEEQPSGE